MGRFIRKVTRGYYNHVSVALDPRLAEVYSFSRLKYETPLCGGFVREGVERYRGEDRGHTARIAVCAVSVDLAHMVAVRTLLSRMATERDRYIYNMLSAVFTPLKARFSVRDSYTCVEFALMALRTAGHRMDGKYYTVTDLYESLFPNIIYEGEYPKTAAAADSSYREDIPVRSRITRSTRQIWRVVYRFVRG